MIHLFLIITMVLLAHPMLLRGGMFHNHIVTETDSIFRRAGFDTFTEHAIRLNDGRLDFVDILVQRGNHQLCIEIETTARNVLDNAAKAEALGLPLWIIVPNQKVKKAVTKKLKNTKFRPGNLPIYFSLLSELDQALTNSFSFFPSANGPQKNKKTNKPGEKS